MRSDKDCEPETYGEGIKKKDGRYRRTLYLKTVIFWEARRTRASAQTPKFEDGETGFGVSVNSANSSKETVAPGSFSVGRSVGSGIAREPPWQSDH